MNVQFKASHSGWSREDKRGPSPNCLPGPGSYGHTHEGSTGGPLHEPSTWNMLARVTANRRHATPSISCQHAHTPGGVAPHVGMGFHSQHAPGGVAPHVGMGFHSQQAPGGVAPHVGMGLHSQQAPSGVAPHPREASPHRDEAKDLREASLHRDEAKDLREASPHRRGMAWSQQQMDELWSRSKQMLTSASAHDLACFLHALTSLGKQHPPKAPLVTPSFGPLAQDLPMGVLTQLVHALSCLKVYPSPKWMRACLGHMKNGLPNQDGGTSDQLWTSFPTGLSPPLGSSPNLGKDPPQLWDAVPLDQFLRSLAMLLRGPKTPGLSFPSAQATKPSPLDPLDTDLLHWLKGGLRTLRFAPHGLLAPHSLSTSSLVALALTAHGWVALTEHSQSAVGGASPNMPAVSCEGEGKECRQRRNAAVAVGEEANVLLKCLMAELQSRMDIGIPNLSNLSATASSSSATSASSSSSVPSATTSASAESAETSPTNPTSPTNRTSVPPVLETLPGANAGGPIHHAPKPQKPQKSLRPAYRQLSVQEVLGIGTALLILCPRSNLGPSRQNPHVWRSFQTAAARLAHCKPGSTNDRLSVSDAIEITNLLAKARVKMTFNWGNTLYSSVVPQLSAYVNATSTTLSRTHAPASRALSEGQPGICALDIARLAWALPLTTSSPDKQTVKLIAQATPAVVAFLLRDSSELSPTPAPEFEFGFESKFRIGHEKSDRPSRGPHFVGGLLWGLGTMGGALHKDRGPELEAVLSPHVQPFTADELSTVVWSLAKLSDPLRWHVDPSLLTLISSLLHRLMAGSAANMGGLSPGGTDDQGVQSPDRTALGSTESEGGVSPGRPPNKGGLPPGITTNREVLSRGCPANKGGLPSGRTAAHEGISPGHLAKLLWALAKLEFRPPPHFMAIIMHVSFTLMHRCVSGFFSVQKGCKSRKVAGNTLAASGAVSTEVPAYGSKILGGGSAPGSGHAGQSPRRLMRMSSPGSSSYMRAKVLGPIPSHTSQYGHSRASAQPSSSLADESSYPGRLKLRQPLSDINLDRIRRRPSPSSSWKRNNSKSPATPHDLTLLAVGLAVLGPPCQGATPAWLWEFSDAVQCHDAGDAALEEKVNMVWAWQRLRERMEPSLLPPKKGPSFTFVAHRSRNSGPRNSGPWARIIRHWKFSSRRRHAVARRYRKRQFRLSGSTGQAAGG
eukprot:gene25358-11019_t